MDSSHENAASADASKLSLVDELRLVLEHANGNAITFRELIDVLRERGMGMVLLLLTLPFVIPVPTFGLSTPAGALVAIYGACLVLNLPPWIPGFIGKRHISYPVLERTVHAAITVGRRFEKLLKPRLKFMLWPGINVLIGVSLAFCGFFLALPLPIPFTNAIPAVAIMLLLLGVLERDGVFVLAGQIASLLIFGAFVSALIVLYMYGWDALQAVVSKFVTTQPS